MENPFNICVGEKNKNQIKLIRMCPEERWSIFSPIILRSNSYSEFKMKCELAGYTGYFSLFDKKNELKIYDIFILSESCHYSEERREVYHKILMFVDQLNELRFKPENMLSNYITN